MMNPTVLSPSVLVASADSNDDDLSQQCSMHGFHLRCSISFKSYQAAIISNLVKTTQTFSSFHPGPDEDEGNDDDGEDEDEGATVRTIRVLVLILVVDGGGGLVLMLVLVLVPGLLSFISFPQVF